MTMFSKKNSDKDTTTTKRVKVSNNSKHVINTIYFKLLNWGLLISSLCVIINYIFAYINAKQYIYTKNMVQCLIITCLIIETH